MDELRIIQARCAQSHRRSTPHIGIVLRCSPMAPRTAPPFRADRVGGLLRPPELKEARARRASGAITAEELRAVEDRSIKDAIAKQEAVGLEGVTDGEFRRAWWHLDFLIARA